MAEVSGTCKFLLLQETLDNIDKPSFFKHHIPPEKAGEELMKTLHVSGLCNVSPQKFLELISPPQWKLFGEKLWKPQFHLTGSSTENLTETFYRTTPLFSGMASDYDIMVIIGSIKKIGVTENSQDAPGFFKVRSSFHSPLTTLENNNCYLDPCKVVQHFRSVVCQVFNKQYFEIKIQEDSENSFARPAVTIRPKILNSEQHPVMLDIVPALDTGEIITVQMLINKRVKQPLCAVSKSKTDSLQWRMSYSLAEREFFTELSSDTMKEVVKKLKANLKQYPDSKVREHICSYHVKTAACYCLMQSHAEVMTESEIQEKIITFLCDAVDKNCLPVFFNKKVNLLNIPEYEKKNVIDSLLKLPSAKHTSSFDKSKDDAFCELEDSGLCFKIDQEAQKIYNIDIEESNKTDLCSNAPLHIAAVTGNTEVAELLITEQNADVNETDTDDRTPLHIAAIRGHTCMVELLMKYNANMNQTDNNGRTAFDIAAELGHIEIAELLIHHFADAVNKSTLFHLVAAAGHTEMADLLIQNKADVNQVNENCESPLYMAAAFGQSKMSEFLVNHNADVNQCEKNGVTPLAIAANGGHIDTVKFLIKYADINQTDTDGETPLHCAARGGHYDIVKLLIENGVDVNQKNNDGRTALRTAVINGHAGVVELLVKYAADVNQSDSDGDTLLHVVTLAGRVRMASALIEQNADVNMTDEEGWTPLHRAAARGHTDLAKLLLQNKANVNQTDIEGWTPLRLAVSRGYKKIAGLLLNNDANVNQTDIDGCTPLHLAAERGHTEIAELLIKYNSDINIMNNEGWTPLRIAIGRGQIDIVKLLIDNNVDVNKPNSSGCKPLDVARALEQDEIAHLLNEHGAHGTKWWSLLNCCLRQN